MPRVVALTAFIFLLVLNSIASAAPSAAAMVTAGKQFVDALTPQQAQQAVFPLDSKEMFKWNVVPDAATPCTGLSLQAMTSAQRTLAQNLLRTGLSEKGFTTVTSIRELDKREALNYCVSIFGSPAPDADWGWRVDGPHLSLHFTVVKGNLVSAVPVFIGSSPAEVRTGKQKGLRLLAEQEDAARAMVMALAPEQQAKAIIDKTAPDEIATGNKDPLEPMKPAGLQSKDMKPEQRLQLIGVVKTWAGLLADDLARDRVDRIFSAGVDQLYFAWAGATEAGQPHYYRIQGPTFVIEFDNAQDGANHAHGVWRDFNGDFGRNLVRERAAPSASSNTTAR